MNHDIDDVLDALEDRKYIVVRTCNFGIVFTNPLKDWEARELWEKRPGSHNYHIAYAIKPKEALYAQDLPLLEDTEENQKLREKLMRRYGWIYKDVTWDEERWGEE